MLSRQLVRSSRHFAHSLSAGRGCQTPVQVVWRSAPLPITELTLDPADGPAVEQLQASLDHSNSARPSSEPPLMLLRTAYDADESRWLLRLFPTI